MQDLQNYRKQNEEYPPAKIFNVCNIKGGVGKTTITIGISSTLKLIGYRVLVIDTDTQANLTAFFLERKVPTLSKPTISNIFEGKDTDSIIYKTKFGIDIIPSNLSLEKFLKISDLKKYKLLLNYVDSVRNSYDFVVMDTPPNSGFTMESSLIASQYVLFALDADDWAFDCIYKL